jgi:hypothetical protein
LTLETGWTSVPPVSADELDLDRELLGHPDREQVDVDRPPGERMDLDRMHDHRARLLPVDREVHERGGADVPAEEVELVRVDRDGLALGAVAVDDGGQEAIVPEPGDLLAGHGAAGGREAGSVGHDGDPRVWWRPARPSRVAGRGRVVAGFPPALRTREATMAAPPRPPV